MSAPQKSHSTTSATERFTEALALIPELSRVEDAIRASFRSDVAPMREIPEYLLALGGKRIRPVLTLLCAKALGTAYISEELVNVAAGIELIHMATLMHDDIIDQSPVRRHKQSPYAKFGTNLTLLSGDFLLTRAFGLCAKLDDEIVIATEKACIELVEGEALETPLHLEHHSKETSITIATRKTASLFRLAAFCSAHLSGAENRATTALCEFGETLGIAFQMIDDILDVLATEASLGKRPGLDIAERKPSIVNVLWLESGDPKAMRLRETPNPEGDANYVQESLQILSTSEVMDEAKALAHTYGEKAAQALKTALAAQNSHNSAGEALFDVIEFALSRLR